MKFDAVPIVFAVTDPVYSDSSVVPFYIGYPLSLLSLVGAVLVIGGVFFSIVKIDLHDKRVNGRKMLMSGFLILLVVFSLRLFFVLMFGYSE